MPAHKNKTVFISGAAYEYGELADHGRLFIRHLTRSLLKHEFTIISGYGTGVGHYVVDEALKTLHREEEELLDRLQVFPFPHQEPGNRRKHRHYMLSRAGVAIFIFGNKLEDIAIKEANGMLEEFEIARDQKAILIPVGASGYVSKKLWNTIIEKFDDYFDTRERYELYRQLGQQELHPRELVDVIIQIALQHEEKRVFVSFEHDTDRALKDLLIGQSKNPECPFEITDSSLKEAAPEISWEEKAEARIKQADIVIVLAGPTTHQAKGVLKEIAMARRQGKKIVQLIGHKEGKYKRVPGAGRLYRWTWNNLQKITC